MYILNCFYNMFRSITMYVDYLMSVSVYYSVL